METQEAFHLARAPIVEAVIDFDCAMPPGFAPESIYRTMARDLKEKYPESRRVFVQQHTVAAPVDAPPQVKVERAVTAVQYLHSDGKQIVQVRLQGFSFNRLAPYSRLDEYLPEVQRTWEVFTSTTKPVRLQQLRLRYINRIEIPCPTGRLELDDFLEQGPQVPKHSSLKFLGFLHHHSLVDPASQSLANIILTAGQSEKGILPIIFDITVSTKAEHPPEDWPWISNTIGALRHLKNDIFRNTLTQKCLNLFQQQP